MNKIITAEELHMEEAKRSEVHALALERVYKCLKSPEAKEHQSNTALGAQSRRFIAVREDDCEWVICAVAGARLVTNGRISPQTNVINMSCADMRERKILTVRLTEDSVSVHVADATDDDMEGWANGIGVLRTVPSQNIVDVPYAKKRLEGFFNATEAADIPVDKKLTGKCKEYLENNFKTS